MKSKNGNIYSKKVSASHLPSITVVQDNRITSTENRGNSVTCFKTIDRANIFIINGLNKRK
ncbi:MAG: hypothetical protein K5866_01030 [Treponema sp.]|jgi:hypothetical protein|nr:hypothetical protein [Treponema sp.]